MAIMGTKIVTTDPKSIISRRIIDLSTTDTRMLFHHKQKEAMSMRRLSTSRKTIGEYNRTTAMAMIIKVMYPMHMLGDIKTTNSHLLAATLFTIKDDLRTIAKTHRIRNTINRICQSRILQR